MMSNAASKERMEREKNIGQLKQKGAQRRRGEDKVCERERNGDGGGGGDDDDLRDGLSLMPL